jgi:UDP-N-acetylmuramate dehydrogenase
MLPDFIQTQVDLSARNTLALPGRAEFFAQITRPEQLMALAHCPSLADKRRFILGGGANLVLSGDFHGLMVVVDLKGRALIGEDEKSWRVSAAAGENWHDFVQWTLKQNLPGLENLSLIPGRVGAAPIQNIGAYGLEVGEYLDYLEAVALDTGNLRRFTAAECAFGYRESLFKREGWHLTGRYAITRVVFRLPKRWRPRLEYKEIGAELAQCGIAAPTPFQVAQAVMAIRRRKLPDPDVLPNAGSFFQNPLVSAEFAAALGNAYPELPRYPQGGGQVKLAAGWLIEQAGWKGRNLGSVGMYEHQALVLVNRGGATGREVQNLARAVREAVLARFGVNLIPEPVVLGDGKK